MRTEQHGASGVPRVSVEDDEQQRIDKGVHKSDVQSYLEQKQQNVISIHHPLHPQTGGGDYDSPSSH